MNAIVEAVLRRRRAWVVPVLAFLLAGFMIGGIGQAERDAQATDQLPDGYDSTQVTQLLDELPTGDDSAAIVLFSSDEPLSGADLRALQATFDEAAAAAPNAPGGAGGEAGPPPGAGGAADPTTTLVRSDDGTAAFGIVPVVGVEAELIADQVAELRETVSSDLPDGVTGQVTGPAAVRADLAAVFDGADLRLLGATATVVAILLIVTYRSPLLWLVPLSVVGVADQAAAALATQTLAALGMAWDESTVGILSVLVFGAGTDYALLLISRYRDELRTHEDRYAAMRLALRRTTEAVLASSTTVVVGLLTLLLSLFPATRGLGLACAVGIVVAAFAVLVVLPCALVLFGRWIFWPKTPRVGQATLADGRSLWRRVGDAVAARPAVMVVATLVALAALASGVFRIESGLSEADQFLEKPEAIAAGERLAESFPAGAADPTIVVTRDDPAQVTAAVMDVEGVASVRPGGAGEDLTRLDAVLDAAPGSDAAADTVRDVRAAVADFEETYVGGTVAAGLDVDDATSRDRLVIIPLILVLVLVALGLLLRSVVAPVLLVASVVATYFAALGTSWWLFTSVFGFERLDSGMPLLAFLFLVALGVDYNIFLVTRAAEESRRHGPREGMLRGLAATGGVITSAGILLAAVFAVLGVLPLVVLAQLGVVICVGVLLDTLVVRTVLVPALALVLGDRFWWPRTVTEEQPTAQPASVPASA